MTRLGVGILCGLVTATPALAQDAAGETPRRSGFSAELAAGPFLSRVACTSCEDVTTTASGGGFLRVGVALSERVVLALEAMGQSTESFAGSSEEGLRVEKANVSLIALWFPWRSGFFVKAGVGTSSGRVTVEPPDQEPVETEGTGVGVTTGIGYDFPVSRRLAITVNLGAWISALGDIVLPTRVVDDVIDSSYALTLGLTIR